MKKQKEQRNFFFKGPIFISKLHFQDVGFKIKKDYYHFHNFILSYETLTKKHVIFKCALEIFNYYYYINNFK